MQTRQAQDAQWHKDRLGKVTGTRAFTVVDIDKAGKPKAAYHKLMKELALEFVNGEALPSFQSPAMADGVLREPIARVRFSLHQDVDVRQVGFQDHPHVPRSGASLDGIIDAEKASIEIKCPQLGTHLTYCASKVIPPKYMVQMQWGLACYPELTHCYFVSFHPEAQANLNLHIQRVDRNDAMIARMEDAVENFVQQMLEMETRLRNGENF